MPSTFAPAWLARGNVHVCRKEYDAAIADYEEAQRLEPTNRAVYWNRGLANAGRKDYDRALVDHGAVLALEPESELFRGNPGLLATGTAPYCTRFPGLSSSALTYADAYYQRGNLRMQQADWNAAIADRPPWFPVSSVAPIATTPVAVPLP